MTETNDTSAMPDEQGAKPARKGGGLASKLLPELKQIAGGLGIRTNGMKKADLVSAIQQAQSSQSSQAQQGSSAAGSPDGEPAKAALQEGSQGRQPDRQEEGRDGKGQPQRKGRQQGQDGKEQDHNKQDHNAQAEKQDDKQGRQQDKRKQDGKQGQQGQQQGRGKGQENPKQDNPKQDSQKAAQKQDNQKQEQDGQSQQPDGQSEDEEGGSRRNRRRRGRDRGNAQTSGRGNRHEPDLTVLDDDVLAPCAGILDVLDNYAFVRTSGYLPGTDDVYVSMSMVRKYGLRRGDAIVGQVRQPREGERREKFNPLVEIDAVNGSEPESAKDRAEYADLTPIHPAERLRLETAGDEPVGRVLDLVSPIGKGQRGLVVSPAKAGKTRLLRSIAAAITANHPETHLMVVLVDERPEEVTDFERSVRGEVVSSTFDRPATDHTTVAELAIERAKRLVELGHDVVVLLDGITRLARSYNLAAPIGGRILEGGVDAAALHPAKRFFGAARNVENGGSLTILATVAVDGGSAMDEVIHEEIDGAANLEVRLSRELADQGLFPPVDPQRSGTRHEELLMGAEELAIVNKLRRQFAGLGTREALELLLGRISGSRSNIELLNQVKQSTQRD